jgi:hypothetical protein
VPTGWPWSPAPAISPSNRSCAQPVLRLVPDVRDISLYGGRVWHDNRRHPA